MAPELQFFFYIGSTYTYLSVNRINEMTSRAGIPIRWRPFHARGIMIEQNNRPFVGKPVKLQYMWRDLERRAQRHGIPFRSIPRYPVDPEELANRVAVVASLEGWCSAYAKAIYRDWFLENKMPGDVEHLRRQLAAMGKDAEAVIERANGQDIRDRFAAETQQAKDLGIFGSPTFAWGSEIFWGDDRLEDALDWAKAHPDLRA
jgi:2-hydroxychromene-2-carboxylate isomerase